MNHVVITGGAVAVVAVMVEREHDGGNREIATMATATKRWEGVDKFGATGDREKGRGRWQWQR